MTGPNPLWLAWAAIAFGAGAAGVVYAQTAGQAPEPDVAATSENEAAGSGEPKFPELLPGYYNQTLTIRAMDIQLSALTKWGGRRANQPLQIPPITEPVCHTNEELQRASDSLWRGLPGTNDCQLVSATMIGTRGEGEFRCTSQQFRMTMRYAGEFTPTSARFSLTGEMRTKSREAEMSFKADIVMERFAETCSEEPEEGEDETGAAAAASEAATVATQAAKKM